MSDNVVSLADARFERTPHLSGEAQCLACKHEWVAVAPTGTTELDCPSCAGTRGVWMHAIIPEANEQIYVCNHCRGFHFIVRPANVMCVGCGASHLPWADA